jgi:hypothetical protein
MVSVDTVYQKVLALANKEQRGYITPQDFNLFANQAQLEIFEQYFYDVNQASRQPGNDTDYSDMLTMLDEKMEIFETFTSVPFTSIFGTLGVYDVSSATDDLYRVQMIFYADASVSKYPIIFEKVTEKEFWEIQKSPLTRPTAERPVYANMAGFSWSFYTSVSPSEITVNYIREPEKVNWTYVVINKQAMYDANPSTQDFELHPSEENQLVNKILRLAGISNQQPDIMRAGAVMDQTTTQQQPKI